MYTEVDRDRLIETYLNNGFRIVKACDTIGLAYNTWREWMKEEGFSKRFNEAKQRSKNPKALTG